MAKRILLFIILSSLALLLHAQQSPSYKIEQGTFNSGGNPSPELASTNYKMTLDSIGESVIGTGLASASNRIDTGLPAADVPPGEVSNLLFTDKTTLTWTPEPSVGSYNIYRGDLTGLPGSYGTKVQTGLTVTNGTDAETPDPGQCLIYVVTTTNRIGEEGPKGH